MRVRKNKEIVSASSKLDVRIHNLLNLICDLRLMEQNVMELEYDATRAPLGKLTAKQINAGYLLLKKIENFIMDMDYSRKFVETVNDYYTKIPHSFGMRQPPLIKSVEQLKTELSLLEMLGNIVIGIRAIEEGVADSNLNPIDSHYLNMKCDIIPIPTSDPQYQLIEKYLQNTHAPTHSRYRMKIKQLFAVNRYGEKEKFMKDLGNRKLIWHGSRLTNWYGILSQGLRIAPPEAPSTGYMFGKGIYFADMSSKSANYCFPQKDKPGLVVLAEVALGESRLLVREDCSADKINDGKQSTIGLGKIGPNPAMEEIIEDGCTVPCGTPITLKENEEKNCALNYNEYVVYNTDQVRIRFALILDFIFQP